MCSIICKGLLTGPGQACKTPQFSPDGKHLIWLERDIGKPHHNVQRLMRIKWDVVETVSFFIHCCYIYKF